VVRDTITSLSKRTFEKSKQRGLKINDLARSSAASYCPISQIGQQPELDLVKLKINSHTKRDINNYKQTLKIKFKTRQAKTNLKR